MNERIKISKQILKKLYINKKLTLQKISKIFNCSFRTIHQKLVKYDISRRRVGYLKYNISKKKLYYFYHIKKQSARKIANIFGCQEALIGYYLKKYDIPKKTRSEIMLIHSAKGKNSGRFKYGNHTYQHYCKDCGYKVDCRSKRCYKCEMKFRWLDLNYKEKTVKKMFESINLKPNKPEKLLNKILQQLFPKEYKFVGDGQFILGGLCPDFININGQKKIIEHYGDYWHNLESWKKRDKRRIQTYKKYGYKTLIIWEHELKNLDKLRKNIKEFHNV